MEQRPRRYMVAVLPPQQLAAAGIAAQPLDMATLEKLLEGEPGVCVHRRVPASPRDSTTAARRMPFPDIIVAEMTYEQAGALRRQLPQLHLERDRLLTYSGADRPADRLSDPALVMPAGEEIDFTFLVQDTDGRPVPNAAVFVTGSGWPAHAVTGAEGRATVTLVGETPETIRSVVVRPQDGQWTARLERPALSVAHDNLVTLHSLSETFPGFPDQQTFGWGQQAMHLHRLPPTFRGGGVKVAIIDSGAAADHPDLRGELNDGVDLVDRRERGWTVDTVHRGSYSAGVITAADNGCGVVGIAVESLVHACKIFPNGRYSDLIEALDHCIEAEIDVVALGLGGSRPSPLVAAKIDQARHAGVACVVGAGDDGGPVAFPGNLPTVLTVAALGRTGTFPPDTSHAAEVFGPQTGEGYFSPRFTCHGSEVDVCAPGVAVLTVAPPDDYTVRDGTSLAAAHVTGLAALALAHHGDFRNGLGRQRGAARVDHLFQLIKSTCTPLDLGDPHRTGAGLPDALRLLGPALAGIPELPSEVLNLLDRLTAEMIQAGLLPSAPTPAPEAATAPVLAAMPPIAPGPGPAAPGQTAPGQTALAWLAEEMRIAGLLVEGPPDPLE
ncbi:S8 family serine peptidase [Thermomonospora echinospora]|uniref:S8 family serine peptidase n=1 Tax=Thermomonospora echinospora TaxID=1992 RepID=UPI001359C955|nr:S8 family serine peptidase [Thermomonospora echinospora]